jgi:phage portal protein BeeE
MLTRTGASLSAWLAGAYGYGLRLEPDLDKVAGLAAGRDQLWTEWAMRRF